MVKFPVSFFAFIVSFILYLPLGANIWRGDLTRDLCVTIFGAKIWRGLHIEEFIFRIEQYAQEKL